MTEAEKKEFLEQFLQPKGQRLQCVMGKKEEFFKWISAKKKEWEEKSYDKGWGDGIKFLNEIHDNENN